MRKWLPGAHMEERKGTREQAKAYCSKDDTRIEGPWEKGNWEAGGIGTRTDLRRIKEKLDAGVSTECIAHSDEHFETWCKYRGAFNEYKKIRTSPRTWKTEVYVYWGESGTGKSTMAQQMAPNAYWKTNDEYWDGYNGEEDVIIDDFYGWIRYDIMLRLLDRYPMDVNARYGHRRLAAKRMFITSNKRPEDWYPNIIDKKPLLRRIEHIVHYRELINKL